MELALVRPTDDDDIVDALLVQHKSPGRKFKIDWDKSLTEVKKNNPETWNVSEVFEALRVRGWEIFHFNPITVGY